MTVTARSLCDLTAWLNNNRGYIGEKDYKQLTAIAATLNNELWSRNELLNELQERRKLLTASLERMAEHL